MQSAESCPLCFFSDNTFFHRDKHRSYYQCVQCALVFVPAHYHLSLDDEKRNYDLHQNNPNDVAYREFLDRLFKPLNKALKPNSKGLDFGCGPGPTLALMLEEEGHSVALYDAFFAQNSAVFTCSYDFISATEVVEHLVAPGFELKRLWALLKPGGVLSIMTKRVLSQSAFTQWHYKNDPTHIVFFSEKTLNYLGGLWGVKPVFHSADVVFFIKPNT